jgi:hypothetical protein
VERGSWASTVTRENRLSSAGVVLAIARSDHCHSRLDAQVCSDLAEGMFQLPTTDKPGQDPQRFGIEICAEQRLSGKRAAVIANERGSGWARERMGTGEKPVEYQMAVWVRISTGRSCSPYQWETASGVRRWTTNLAR